LGVNADGRCFQTGVAAADSFAVNTPTGAPVIPAICGINTGQHSKEEKQNCANISFNNYFSLTKFEIPMHVLRFYYIFVKMLKQKTIARSLGIVEQFN